MPLFPAALAAALAFGLFTVTPAAEAQPAGKVVRIGLLDYAASDPASAARWTALRDAVTRAAYVEGQNVIYEPRWGDGQGARLRSLAAELIAAKVDVLVTAGSEAALAA